MGGCQNYGSLLGALSIRFRTIMGIQKGTITLTTTHTGIIGYLYCDCISIMEKKMETPL